MSGWVLGLIGGVLVFIWGLLQPQRVCPHCGTLAPRLRFPQTWRQFMWGGWTCTSCSKELDRHGMIINQ